MESIETENVKVLDYQSDLLQSGISAIDTSNVEEYTGGSVESRRRQRN